MKKKCKCSSGHFYFAVVIMSFVGCSTGRDDYSYMKMRALEDRRQEKSVVVQPKQVPSTPLTLSDTIALVVANNSDIEMAASRIRKAEAMLGGARAAFWPRIDGGVDYIRSNTPSTYLFKSIDQGSLEAGTDFNNPGIIDNYGTTLGVQYNLFNGGLDILHTWQAETGLALSKLDSMTLRNALVASAIATWYDLQASDSFVTTALESKNTVKAQLDERTKIYEAGGDVLKTDVLSLQVRLAEAREALIIAQNKRSLGAAALANLLNANADTPIVLHRDDSYKMSIPTEYSEALRMALVARPELSSVKNRIELAAMSVDAAASGYLPQLNAHANSLWDDESMSYNANDTNWMLGLGLRWNFFEGGRTSAKKTAAEATLAEALEADKKATLRIQLEVKKAYLSIRSSTARKEVAGIAVLAAEETLTLVKLQYDKGAATITRYLEAELMLTRAKLRKTQALYASKKSVSEAARSIGLFAQQETN